MTDLEYTGRGNGSWRQFEKGTTVGERTRFGPGNQAGDQFRPGHELTTTHGATSSRRVAPIADALAAQLVEDAPWTGSPAFAGTAQSWAHAEAQAALLRVWLDEHGLLDEDGQESGAAKMYDRVETRLSRLRDQLGLTPRSLGQLLATAAGVATATGDEASLQALQAEGRAILSARLTAVTADEVGEATA